VNVAVYREAGLGYAHFAGWGLSKRGMADAKLMVTV
jgi:hypothetical protein